MTNKKKHTILPGEFFIDREKGTVVFAQMSKGQLYTGSAKVDGKDTFSEERGKRIAMLRCDLKIRKRDKDNVLDAIENLKEIKEDSLILRGFIGTDKIYTVAIQNAYEVLNAHYNAIREIKKELKSYMHPE